VAGLFALGFVNAPYGLAQETIDASIIWIL